MTINLTILCEGETERNFVVQTLGPYLRKFKDFAKPIDVGGQSKYFFIKEAVKKRISV